MPFTVGKKWNYADPSEEKMDDLYVNNAKMYGVYNETFFQMGLSIWALKSYGIEDYAQLVSLGFSFICLWKSQADRVTFTRYRNPTTCQILGTWTEWLFMILSQCIITLACVVDESIDPWFNFLGTIEILVSLLSLSLLNRLRFKIFKRIANWFLQIPLSYCVLFIILNAYSFVYLTFMVKCFFTYFFKNYQFTLNLFHSWTN